MKKIWSLLSKGLLILGRERAQQSGVAVPTESSGYYCGGTALRCSREIFLQVGEEAQPGELEVCPHKQHEVPGQPQTNSGVPHNITAAPLPFLSVLPRPGRSLQSSHTL